MMKKNGFGILEILIMVAIMAALFSMVATYTKRGGEQIQIFREQARFVSEFMRAKSLALQRIQGTEKICGYGLSFLNEKEIVLFKNTPIGNSCTNFAYDDSSEDVEKIKLEGNVEILNRTVTTMLFLPPEPKVYFDQALATGEVFVILGIRERNSTKITINSGGQIVVE